MQNEPQLTAEMEKRFDEEFAHLSVLIDQALSYTYVDSKNMGELKIKDIKHFLATAITQERNKVIELLKKFLGYHCDEPNCDHNLEEAIKVLNQLKGNHD